MLLPSPKESSPRASFTVNIVNNSYCKSYLHKIQQTISRKTIHNHTNDYECNIQRVSNDEQISLYFNIPDTCSKVDPPASISVDSKGHEQIDCGVLLCSQSRSKVSQSRDHTRRDQKSKNCPCATLPTTSTCNEGA